MADREGVHHRHVGAPLVELQFVPIVLGSRTNRTAWFRRSRRRPWRCGMRESAWWWLIDPHRGTGRTSFGSPTKTRHHPDFGVVLLAGLGSTRARTRNPAFAGHRAGHQIPFAAGQDPAAIGFFTLPSSPRMMQLKPGRDRIPNRLSSSEYPSTRAVHPSLCTNGECWLSVVCPSGRPNKTPRRVLFFRAL